MSTPSLTTFIKRNIERRDLGMQTTFPAKVVSWDSGDNTVVLEPQFIEAWVTPDGTKHTEEAPEGREIRNVPVLFPRSGSWSITWPIETGSYGMVVCTKYSLDRWRQAGAPTDAGYDLRRFTLSGATFHPVNLYPDNAALSNIDDAHMEIGKTGLTTQFVALANKVDEALTEIASKFNAHGHVDAGSLTGGTLSGLTPVGSTTVKVSE